MPESDPTKRFSDRVEDYARYRPSYPAAAVDWLIERAGLVPGGEVADVGAGTGISARLLLERGLTVSAVEPNDAMRGAAEAALGGLPGFTAVAGTAEATTLPEASVDLVLAAQAFHWFDAVAFAAEAARILRPGRAVALMWNTRLTTGSPFAEGYEALLLDHGTDYRKVHHHRLTEADFGSFFAGAYETAAFPYAQRFDFPALRGRLLSSSYTPPPGHRDHGSMLDALALLFEQTAEGGEVVFAYETEVYVGRVG